MMTAATLLEVWERGESGTPAERAALALSAFGGLADSVLDLPADDLNRRLLDTRRRLFGASLAFYAECNRCGEAVEFAVDASALCDQPTADLDTAIQLDGGLTLTCRAPTSAEILAAAGSADPRRTLFEQCVTSVDDDTDATAVALLTDSAIEAVEEWLDRNHPLLDITLEITCPECGHDWIEMLDINAHLWRDIRMEASRLLTDVAALAGAYGWSEREILEMTPERRAYYLDVVA